MSHMPTGPQPATSPASWPPASTPERDRSQLLAVVGVVLGLLGLIVGVAAWFRAAPASVAPVYSEQQVADAKKAVCDAFTEGQSTLAVTGRKQGTSPDALFAIAINSRVAINTVTNHLRLTLIENPATPATLGSDIRQLDRSYQTVLLMLLADKTSPELDPIYNQIDSSVDQVRQHCQ